MTVVPSGSPASSMEISFPPLILYMVPVMESFVFVHNSTLETAAILERASPRNPKDVTNDRSSALLILLVE